MAMEMSPNFLDTKVVYVMQNLEQVTMCLIVT